MTVEYFKEMCAREGMREISFNTTGQRTQDESPYSELEMHCRVAGKFPKLIAVSANNQYAYVLTQDDEFVDGLTGEVVPFGARPVEPAASEAPILGAKEVLDAPFAMPNSVLRAASRHVMNDKGCCFSERPFQATDAPFIVAAHLFPHAQGFVSEPPTEDLVINSLSVPTARRRIVLNERGEPVGLWMAGLHEGWLVQIGLIISASPRSGVGRYALRSALHWAFEEVSAHRAWLEVTASNTVARHLYESEGFLHEGSDRDGFRHRDGRFEDLAHYGMLEREYRARVGP